MIKNLFSDDIINARFREIPKYSRHLSNCFIIFLGLILLDQITKFIAVNYLSNFQDNTLVINNYLNLSLIQNNGISFGLGHNLFKSNFLIFVCLIFLILAYFVNYTFSLIKLKKNIIPQVLIISGAISNLIDRLTYGAVIDFIELRYKDYFFPVFNLADVAITLGVALIFLELLRESFKNN